ncbi:MAG TPA: hypothetical protein VF677_02840 [Flavobacterium sp.]
MKNTLHFNFLLGLLAVVLGLFFNMAWGQTSVQNFGAGTAAYNSTIGSTGIISNPTSGTTYARAGTSSSINVLNSENPLLGTASYLKASASTGGSVSKVSPMIGYTSNTEFYTSFNIIFAGHNPSATAANGSWAFYQGAGAMYSNNNGFAGNQVFLGLRFNFSSGFVDLDSRQGGSWSNTGFSSTLFPQGTILKIEVVANNKNSEIISYLYNGISHTVGSQKYDLYIGGVLIGNDISSAQLPAGASISSNTFIGINSTGNAANIYVDDIVVFNSVPATIGTAPTSTTWNGTAWSNGTPSTTLDAIIAGNYNSSDHGAFTSKSLTVNSGVFTIASGFSITVQDAVTNNAGDSNFIIQSGANLIQVNNASNTGSITVQRNSAPIVRLDHTLWSSPVSGQNLFGFSPNTLANRFYVYNTETDNYVTTGLSASSVFVPGKGYAVRAPNNFPASPAAAWAGTFKGVPNNGDVSFTLSITSNGYNLVGNPYPSTINATSFVNDANNATKIDGTLYFYAHSLAIGTNGQFPPGTNYTIWNQTGYTLATNSSVVPNGTIQVGQGFIVKASEAGNINFTNTMKNGNTENQFFRTANAYTSNIEKHRIWLNLSNEQGSVFYQTLIGYVAGATAGFDRGYDGLSFGNIGSSLTTTINNSEYAIQARPLPFDISDVVALSFNADTDGTYIISLADTDGIFADNQTVFLKDNTTGTIHNITAGAYTFNTNAGTFANRFEVVYQSNPSTPESTFGVNSIIAFKKSGVLNVEAKNIKIASIKAYDLQGRLIYSRSGINASSIVLSDLQAQNQVLLLQFTSSVGANTTIKVIF